MFSHPAYPTRAQLAREADAETRDLCDLFALRRVRLILSETIIRIKPDG